MAKMSRRSFLKTTASAAAAVPVLTGGWHKLLGAESPGYFEREFGITDALCRKVLAAALAKGGDYADLYFEHTIGNWIILEDGKVSRAFIQESCPGAADGPPEEMVAATAAALSMAFSSSSWVKP